MGAERGSLKRKHAAVDGEEDSLNGGRFPLDRLPCEVFHAVLEHIPVEKVLPLQLVCRRVRSMVESYIGCMKVVRLDTRFCELPSSVDDDNLAVFLARCRSAREVVGIDSSRITRRRSRGRSARRKGAGGDISDRHPLSAPGIVAALSQCRHLRGISTGNVFVLDALLNELPHVEILRDFVNFEFVNVESELLPVPQDSILRLPPLAKVSNLQLTRVVIPRLPNMPTLRILTLCTVEFSEQSPFESFRADKLEKFGMRNCANVSHLAAFDLVRALAGARGLRCLELVRVPFHPGVFHQSQHDERPLWASLEDLTIAACRHCTYEDILDIVTPCISSLKKLSLQASLCVDQLFATLRLAPSARQLCTLFIGYRDPFSSSQSVQALGQMVLEAHGLAPFTEQATPISDFGHSMAFQVAPLMEQLTIENAPSLRDIQAWPCGRHIRRLRLTRCGNVMTSSLSSVITELPCLRHLELTAVGYTAVFNAMATSTQATGAAESPEATLIIRSQSLVTAKVDYCFYHRLELENCPKLNYVMVTRCADLTSLSLTGCHVHTYDFDDCQRLPLSTVLSSLESSGTPLANNTIVMYSLPNDAPKGAAKREEAEEIAFRCFTNESVAVLWHEWPAHKESHQLCGVFASMWADRISKINANLLNGGQLERYDHARPPMVTRTQVSRLRTPSEGELLLSEERREHIQQLRCSLNRSMYVLQRTRNGQHSELLTDLPWMRALLSRNSSTVREFGCCALPRLLPADVKDDVLRLAPTIARLKHEHFRIREHVLFVVATT